MNIHTTVYFQLFFHLANLKWTLTPVNLWCYNKLVSYSLPLILGNGYRFWCTIFMCIYHRLLGEPVTIGEKSLIFEARRHRRDDILPSTSRGYTVRQVHHQRCVLLVVRVRTRVTFRVRFTFRVRLKHSFKTRTFPEERRSDRGVRKYKTNHYFVLKRTNSPNVPWHIYYSASLQSVAWVQCLCSSRHTCCRPPPEGKPWESSRPTNSWVEPALSRPPTAIHQWPLQPSCTHLPSTKCTTTVWCWTGSSRIRWETCENRKIFGRRFILFLRFIFE